MQVLKSLLHIFNIFIYCTQNWMGYGQAGLTPILFNFYCCWSSWLSVASLSILMQLFYGLTALVGLGLLIVEVLISHSDTLHSVGILWL